MHPRQIKMALRYGECHEEVSRRGELQPCARGAVAIRHDGEGGAYPVCPFHARSPMVELWELAALVEVAQA